MSLDNELKDKEKDKAKSKDIKKSEASNGSSKKSESKTNKVSNVKKQPNGTSTNSKSSGNICKGKVLSQGVGRRKSSVARVYLKDGEGNIMVNNVDYKTFFKNHFIYYKLLEPLNFLDCLKSYDFKINVNGGGLNSQVEAVRLGISICLSKLKIENRSILKDVGFLTTDSRIVERKKPGHKKARKSFQFSKR